MNAWAVENQIAQPYFYRCSSLHHRKAWGMLQVRRGLERKVAVFQTSRHAHQLISGCVPTFLVALGSPHLRSIVQQVFSRFLLPQRGQKCNASPFAEDSFDCVADPVITSNPAVAHVGGRNRFRAASHSSRIDGFAARRSFSDRGQSVNTSAFVGTNRADESITSGLRVSCRRDVLLVMMASDMQT